MTTFNSCHTAPLRPRLSAHNAQSLHCYSLRAKAEPGVMPRILALFAKRSLVPHRLHSDRQGPGDGTLAIEFQVAGLTPEMGAYIARCLEQLQDVEQVLTAQKTLP